MQKTKVIGTQTYVNYNTGELIDMDVIETTEKDVDANFHKLFMKDFLSSLDIISNQKIKVAFWVIDNIDKNNQLLHSYRDIAELTGIGYQTVATTIKTLKDADFLRKKGKILIVNPDIVFKGSASRRAHVLHTYKNAAAGDTIADRKVRIENMKQTIASLHKQLEKLEAEDALVNGQDGVETP